MPAFCYLSALADRILHENTRPGNTTWKCGVGFRFPSISRGRISQGWTQEYTLILGLSLATVAVRIGSFPTHRRSRLIPPFTRSAGGVPLVLTRLPHEPSMLANLNRPHYHHSDRGRTWNEKEFYTPAYRDNAHIAGICG